MSIELFYETIRRDVNRITLDNVFFVTIFSGFGHRDSSMTYPICPICSIGNNNKLCFIFNHLIPVKFFTNYSIIIGGIVVLIFHKVNILMNKFEILYNFIGSISRII